MFLPNTPQICCSRGAPEKSIVTNMAEINVKAAIRTLSFIDFNKLNLLARSNPAPRKPKLVSTSNLGRETGSKLIQGVTTIVVAGPTIKIT